MSNQTEEKTDIDIDWEEVLLKLQCYARSLINGKQWFRGNKTTVFLKGKEIEDYVFSAIEKYLRNPEKFDPQKGSLINYLQYNLIRSMVGNDIRSRENKTSMDVFTTADNTEPEENSCSYLDSIMPCADAFFDQEIDYNEIMSYIEAETKGDKIVEEIFLGLFHFDLKRREIIEEFSMTEKEYDNGMRRLNTIRNKTADKYKLMSN